jgi:hypothetical protein
MKTTIAALTLLLLAGCVTQANLVADNGQRYLLKIDPVNDALSAEIDSISYKGKYVMGSASGLAFGGKPTVIAGSSNNGQAVLTAPTGDAIDCNFMASGSTVMGRCESNKGRKYVLTTE